MRPRALLEIFIVEVLSKLTIQAEKCFCVHSGEQKLKIKGFARGFVFFVGEDILPFRLGNDTLGEFSLVFFGNGKIWTEIQQGEVSGRTIDNWNWRRKKLCPFLPSAVV